MLIEPRKFASLLQGITLATTFETKRSVREPCIPHAIGASSSVQLDCDILHAAATSNLTILHDIAFAGSKHIHSLYSLCTELCNISIA